MRRAGVCDVLAAAALLWAAPGAVGVHSAQERDGAGR